MGIDLATIRAEALLLGEPSRAGTPEPARATRAITNAVRRYGGNRGCAARMAAEFGDHPDTAVRRMGWAPAVAASTCPGWIGPGTAHRGCARCRCARVSRPRPAIAGTGR